MSNPFLSVLNQTFFFRRNKKKHQFSWKLRKIENFTELMNLWINYKINCKLKWWVARKWSENSWTVCTLSYPLLSTLSLSSSPDPSPSSHLFTWVTLYFLLQVTQTLVQEINNDDDVVTFLVRKEQTRAKERVEQDKGVKGKKEKEEGINFAFVSPILTINGGMSEGRLETKGFKTILCSFGKYGK